MTRWVVDLHDTAAAEETLVGGKAAALHRLLQAGLPVPEAFVVTTEAFREHFPGAASGQRPPPAEFHPGLTRAITEALTARFETTASLAVRSSAVGEDGHRASFAGQHETYYFIAPAEVAAAVGKCWLSLWSPRAESYRTETYRAEHGGQDGPLAMAVVVQRMVAADRSGVCFTADPTGRHAGQVWIETAWGLGAALVDGRVCPDRLLMDRAGNVVRRQTGRKRHRVAVDPGGPADTRLEPVPLFQQTVPVLSDAQAAEVTARSLEIESLCGTPQDVEWAYEGERFYVLQSRQITTAAAAEPGGRWVIFKPLAENFTEPLTPMTVDLFRRVLPPFGRFIRGRYYLNLDVARRLCPFRWSTRELTDAMLLRGDVPELRWDWRKAPLVALGFAAAYLGDGIAWHRSAHLTRESLGEYARLCQRLSTDRDCDPLGAIRRLVLGRHPFEPLGRLAYYVNVSAGRYFLLLGVLNKLVERHAPHLDRHLVGQLCSGDGGTFSRQLVEGIRALAEVARRDADLSRRLSATDVQEITQTLASLPGTHPFALALDRFLDTFGHRCMREMELAVPRWREDPLPVLLMVRGHLMSPAPPSVDPHALHLLARNDLRNALQGRWQQRLADYLVSRVRYYTSLREDTRHYHAMAMDVVRSKLLDLEQMLLADGRLRLAGDVFYLTWREALALKERRLGWRDVAERVRERRRSEQAAIRTGPTEVFGGSHTLLDVTAELSNGGGLPAVLTGQCASPGTAEGRVRIVLDPATANQFATGEILVAPYTDPAWTPLFPLAAAVVVEVGSFLSHAGTVAREYGIPCLVDVVDCTRRLREGQRIRVYASDGRIEVLGP